jgi:hypothetical protein
MWVVALLVAAAACQDLRALLMLRSRLRPLRPGEMGVGLLAGEIELGTGPDGAIAIRETVQVGRALDASVPAITFHDQRHASVVSFGVVRVGGTKVYVAPEARRAVVSASKRAERTAACADARAFDAAYAVARTAKGFVRTLVDALRAGDRVFLSGEVARVGETLVVRAPPGGELLVSADDPRAFVASRCRLIAGFIAVELLACAACTRVVTWPPAFGLVGTIGGLLCLAFFLGVTPIGVWVRDRCRLPGRGVLGGVWTKAG